MEENKVSASSKPENKQKFSALKWIIYSAYISSLFLLIIVALALIANTKLMPFYGWIEGSRFESFGNFTAGLIIEQKVTMQIEAQNTPLSPEETEKLTLLFNQKNYLNSSLKKDELSPRDSRFLLAHPEMTPVKAGKYLILTNSESEEVLQFAGILDDLYVSFVNEMHPCDFTESTINKAHICYLKNRADYLSVSRKSSHNFHDSLGFFSPIRNCIYLFSRAASLEGLEMEEKYNKKLLGASKIYQGEELLFYKNSLELEKQRHLLKLQEETLCTLRHEGTHQLAHMLGIHSQRGFEKKWLTEGIAQFFETKIPGQPRPAKKEKLLRCLQKNELFKWQDLINRNDITFDSSGHRHRQIAYSQSWLLVRLLMTKYKSSFFEYIKLTKKTGALDESHNQFQILCKTIKISPEKFIEELNTEIKSL